MLSLLPIALLGCTPPDTLGPAEIGPDGGVVQHDGMTLTIPPGALAQPVTIDVCEEPAPAGYEALSPLYCFEPAGTVLSRPATLQIAHDPHAYPTLFWTDPLGGFQHIDATFDDGVATATVDLLAEAFVAVTPPDSVTSDTVFRPADVVVVVDSSNSMVEEQHQLALQGPVLLDALRDEGLDFHLGVITTDMSDIQNHAGKLQRVGTTSFIDASTPDASALFDTMLTVGNDGAFTPRGRAAAYTLVEIKRDIARNEGFIRDDATLDLVFVSDADDQSASNPITEAEFLQWVDVAKGERGGVTAHGIVGLPDGLCDAVHYAGHSYLAYAEHTDGVVMDACAADWTAGLQQIVSDLAQPRFPLEPWSEIVRVTFVGDPDVVLAPSDYTALPDGIHFDRGVRAPDGTTVRVDYRPL